MTDIDLDRSAYMLTDVRGARILARALNYERPGMPDRPTFAISKLGVHCQAIMESRHVDVLEIDAAFNTGIGIKKEIIEAIRYKPASARYRTLIINEVHMLPEPALNELLKALEAPPPHVKFIFTGKVPEAILSRCQRYATATLERSVT